MMQTTDFGNLHDHARLRPLDGSDVRCILLEREMSSCAVIVREVAGQDAAQVTLAQNEDMVQTIGRIIRHLHAPPCFGGCGPRALLLTPSTLSTLTLGRPDRGPRRHPNRDAEAPTTRPESPADICQGWQKAFSRAGGVPRPSQQPSAGR